MNNGDINNNVVPNTTNVTNNVTNTGVVPPQAASATPTITSSQPVLQPVTTVNNQQAPVVQNTGTVLPNSQPVLNPSTDVDFSKAVANTLDGENKNEVEDKNNKQNKNANNSTSKTLTIVLFLIIIGLAFYAFYSNSLYKTNLDNLKYNCTPVNSYKENKQLDLNSTIVVELYNKVKTSIREDYAQPEFNDNMKLYLAWRQIPQNKYYGSNCNMFKDTIMEPYKCDPKKFTPQAFKEEDLIHEIKMLYGEETNIPLANIKLQNNCVGGYAYIAERGEFVEGKCDSVTAISFSVDKVLKEAYSNRNTIVLVEEVKYKENEKLQLPDYLKSGTYTYTFRLDMNFNYVLVDRTYESKY